MKVIILAAGQGTRLLPITLETPKPLIEIAGRPIIDRIFQSLPDSIDEAIIVVEHLKEKIISHLGESFNGMKVRYVDQINKKGTFAALLSAKDLLEENERFLVLNGDDIHDKVELTEYLNYPRSFGVQYMNMPNYYSIKMDEKNYIKGFFPQTDQEKKGKVVVATGAYVLDKNIFEHQGVSVYGGELGLPQTILAQKESHPVKGIITTRWITINSFEDIERTNFLL